ncbi:hypothetical protein SLS56_006148 [Neofusicoccum ribis]|uniref:Uncharacterized protein n=1 Tax=Neofusicoccum ribis TaxID=45134 RepID=A0ABR3SRP5_9PEZI
MNFRRMEIKFEGLSPEQKAFLREKAILDTLPPTPSLPILSPTPTTTPATTASLLPHHANPSHHSYFPTTYTSTSAPHLSTTTTLNSISGPGAATAAAHHTTHSTPHLGGHTDAGRGAQRSSRRFSAINLLRGSWNNSHPVSAEDRRIANGGGSDNSTPRRRQHLANNAGSGDRRRHCQFEFADNWEKGEVGGGGFELQVVRGVASSVRSAGRDSEVTLGGGGSVDGEKELEVGLGTRGEGEGEGEGK